MTAHSRHFNRTFAALGLSLLLALGASRAPWAACRDLPEKLQAALRAHYSDPTLTEDKILESVSTASIVPESVKALNDNGTVVSARDLAGHEIVLRIEGPWANADGAREDFATSFARGVPGFQVAVTRSAIGIINRIRLAAAYRRRAADEGAIALTIHSMNEHVVAGGKADSR